MIWLPSKTGLPIVFSSETIDGRAMMSGEQDAARKVAQQFVGIESGQLPGFVLDRLDASYGMSCKGIDGRARKKLLELLASDPMFGGGRNAVKKLDVQPTLIGGCQGLRVKGKSEPRDGEATILDVFAVSDGEVLFLFKLQNLEGNYATNLGTFERALATLQLAVARKASP
jgi:hypothetical protein